MVAGDGYTVQTTLDKYRIRHSTPEEVNGISDISYFEVIFKQSPVVIMGVGIVLTIIGLLLLNLIIVIAGVLLFLLASRYHKPTK